jgi:small subunit ribosomal protein S6
MALYEHVFLARQDVSTQQVETLVEQFRQIIEGAGGKIAKVEAWGLKSLTYRIRKNRKAHFTLLNIEAPPAAVAEVERQERLSEDVIRFLTIKVDEHEEGPSAMLRKSDRDDRPGGGRFGDRDRGPRRDFGDRPRRDAGETPRRETTETPRKAEADAAGAE